MYDIVFEDDCRVTDINDMMFDFWYVQWSLKEEEGKGICENRVEGCKKSLASST